MLYIVSFSGLKMISTKFSLLDITACIKNCIYNNFHLHCYFMSLIKERLQIFSSLNLKFLEILQPYSEAATGGAL